jgi:hypothetical protein
MTKRKGTNNDLQNTVQIPKDRATLKTEREHMCSETYATCESGTTYSFGTHVFTLTLV